MNNKKEPPTSVRLTKYAKRLLERLVQKHGVTKTAIIEMAIREKARKELTTDDNKNN